MKPLLPVLMAVLCSITLQAQLLTWSPPCPAENNPSQIFEITVDAAKGNGALTNYTPTDSYIRTIRVCIKPHLVTNMVSHDEERVLSVEVMPPQSSPVSLRLLNAAGGNIALLHEGFMPKGKTVFPVNRKSLLLPSGIYYIEMTTKYGSTTASVSLL